MPTHNTDTQRLRTYLIHLIENIIGEIDSTPFGLIELKEELLNHSFPWISTEQKNTLKAHLTLLLETETQFHSTPNVFLKEDFPTDNLFVFAGLNNSDIIQILKDAIKDKNFLYRYCKELSNALSHQIESLLNDKINQMKNHLPQ